MHSGCIDDCLWHNDGSQRQLTQVCSWLWVKQCWVSWRQVYTYVCVHMTICICTVATYILIQVMIPAPCVYTLGHTLTIYWNVSWEKVFCKSLKVGSNGNFHSNSLAFCTWIDKPHSLTTVVLDEMIEALGGRLGMLLKYPMVAITTQLSSNERFPFCVYEVAICVHSFLQHVISKMTDERVNLLHDAKNSTTIRCFLLIGPLSVVRLYRLAAPY